jgi:type II secretory pathway pseudopilin PulG
MTSTKIIRKYNTVTAGVTLIELVVTMLIAGIAISGLVAAYSSGLEDWRRESDKMVLYSEGEAALSLMTRFAQRAGDITTYTNVGMPSNRMDLSIPVLVGKTVFYRGAQFYYYHFDKSLRWNNMTGNFDGFNQRLLPLSNYQTRPGEKPYLEIQEASFTPIVPPGETDFSYDDCTSVQMKLVLNDARGDTITLTSVVSRINQPDQ